MLGPSGGRPSYIPRDPHVPGGALYPAFRGSVFLPIVLAILLNLLLSPVVRLLRNHLRMPNALGAGVVIVVLLGVLVFGAYRLTPAASAWLARAPESLAPLQRRIQPLRQPVEKVTEAAEKVEQATDMDKKTPEVEIKGPSLTKQVFGGTTALLSTAMVVIFLTYFLLASGELFLQKLVAVLPQLKDKKTAVRIVRETEAQVSAYLVVTTLINVGVGVVTGPALGCWVCQTRSCGESSRECSTSFPTSAAWSTP